MAAIDQADRGALIAMLERAGADIWEGEATVSVCTGPDDAVAIFRFDGDGQLQSVDVQESGPIPGNLRER